MQVAGLLERSHDGSVADQAFEKHHTAFGHTSVYCFHVIAAKELRWTSREGSGHFERLFVLSHEKSALPRQTADSSPAKNAGSE
jgi:hypothetical protein